MPSVISNLCAAFRFETREKSSSEIIFYTNPRQKIDQSISGKYYPSVNDPARANNVTCRKHRSGCYRCAVLIPTLRNPNPPIVQIGNLRRNLETFFSPRLKLGIRKFGELTPVKLLAVSERSGLVSEVSDWSLMMVGKERSVR